MRVLHDWRAASRLSRVCLDAVQDEGRVGRVEQVKSKDIFGFSPLCHGSDKGKARGVGQVDYTDFSPLDICYYAAWARTWTCGIS